MENVVFYDEAGTILAVGQMAAAIALLDGRAFIVTSQTPDFDIYLTHHVMDGQLVEKP